MVDPIGCSVHPVFDNKRQPELLTQIARQLHSTPPMDPQTKPNTSLFDVYLRLRPSFASGAERFLDVEDGAGGVPKHITIKPPSSDHRKRAVERFAFTRVFEENASQLELFTGTGVVPLIRGVLAADGQIARDGLLATLGVTGSGKVSSRNPLVCYSANILQRVTRF